MQNPDLDQETQQRALITASSTLLDKSILFCSADTERERDGERDEHWYVWFESRPAGSDGSMTALLHKHITVLFLSQT